MCSGSKPRSGALSHEPIVKQSWITMVLKIFFFLCCGFYSMLDELPRGFYCISVKPQRQSGWWVGRVNGRHVAGGKCTCTVHFLPPPLPPSLLPSPTHSQNGARVWRLGQGAPVLCEIIHALVLLLNPGYVNRQETTPTNNDSP